MVTSSVDGTLGGSCVCGGTNNTLFVFLLAPRYCLVHFFEVFHFFFLDFIDIN